VLASTLWVADEYRRLAAVVDDLLPRLAGGDDVEPTLRYYAGVGHVELGNRTRPSRISSVLEAHRVVRPAAP